MVMIFTYMSLEVKKVYVDTRFKTSDSRSDSDFNIELPKSINIPEGTVAYIDDIVIPVSWTAVDERNNKLYFKAFFTGTENFYMVTMDTENYNGGTFASDLAFKLNAVIPNPDITFSCTHNYMSNLIEIKVHDNRASPPDTMVVTFFSDESLKNGDFNGIVISRPKTVNNILRISSDVQILDGQPYYSYIDLHTTRNLYLVSSALGSYDVVSNFHNDTIIKKIPVKASFNEMLFDNASEGFDYLTVSKRTLRYIDFRLVDSYFNTLNLQHNHFSFSIVFQLQR